MRAKLEDEIRRFNKFQTVIGTDVKKRPEDAGVDIRRYAKYLLKEGTAIEKRELLGNLRSRLVYKDHRVSLLPES